MTAAGTTLLAALALAGPAVAAKKESCGDQVIADWYDNQRVDKIYPIHCYRDAIQKLPPDIRDYTGAADAINRALTYAKAGEPDPGGSAGGGSDPGRTGPYKPVAYRAFAEQQVAVADPGAGTTAAGKPTSTSGPSSVPIPLIVLAGLAGVLLVAGGAGYVARRVQARRGGPPPPASP